MNVPESAFVHLLAKCQLDRFFHENNRQTSNNRGVRGENPQPLEPYALNKDPDRTVRVRLINEEGYLTIKGRSNKEGTSRLEWEKFIPKSEAKSLLELAMDMPIEKIRYIIPHGALTIEVDEFLSHKKGLVLAEIELPIENTPFKKPDWLGKEVTGNPNYYNSKM